MMRLLTASLGGFAMPLADLNRGPDENAGAHREAVAGDPVRFELRTVRGGAGQSVDQDRP